MSRRKQSNPKPLIKREDEDEDSPSVEEKDKPESPTNDEVVTNTEDTGATLVTPNSPNSITSNDSNTPKVRLNTLLATDPALRQTDKNKNEELSLGSAINRSSTDLEYIASLPPSLQQALASRLFPGPPPHLTDTEVPENSPLPRTKLEASLPEVRTVAIYLCTPCGIRFSSASTLEAHQTYYCSHRIQKGRNESDADDPKSPQAGDNTDNPTKSIRTGKQYECPHCSYSADKKVSLNRHMRMHSSSPAAPVPVILPSPLVNGTTDQPPELPQLVDRYCQDCDIRFSSVKTFRAHKVHYCSSRHAKGSPTSKTSSTPTSPSDTQRLSPEPAFISLPNRTFRSQQQQQQQQQQPFLALRTNPVLIVPYSLFQSASLFTGAGTQNLPSPDTACILLPNGTFQPMAHLVSKDTRPSQNVSEQVLKIREEHKNGRPRSEPGAPLDLSVRRSSDASELVIDMEDEKENVYASSPDHDDIICTPSIPSMLHGVSPIEDKKNMSVDSMSSTPSPAPAPSPKRSPRRTPNGINRKIERKEKKIEAEIHLLPSGGSLSGGDRRSSSGTILPPNLPLLLSSRSPGASPDLVPHPSILPLLNTELHRIANSEPSGVPQVLVKQGRSKCQECNIVFCRQENFIAHKKHYCSSRLPEDLTIEDRTSPDTSKSPALSSNKDRNSPSPKSTGGGNAKIQIHQQFICMACGIKFTAPDNLTAHQAFYCPKRQTDNNAIKIPIDEKPRRCPKCKIIVSGDHQCINQAQAINGWKCPCCDVISPTAAAAQKHMDTHSNVRAYRCTICRYKGNTLRGMRTHIRMHFDKKSNDLQEENYITCILDEDSAEYRPSSNSSSLNNGINAETPVIVKVEMS